MKILKYIENWKLALLAKPNFIARSAGPEEKHFLHKNRKNVFSIICMYFWRRVNVVYRFFFVCH